MSSHSLRKASTRGGGSVKMAQGRDSCCKPTIMGLWWETKQNLELQSVPEIRLEPNYPEEVVIVF